MLTHKIPLRWHDRALALLGALQVAAVGNDGKVEAGRALARILRGMPDSTYTRYALREMAQDAGDLRLPGLSPEPVPLGSGYRPLYLEYLIENYARDEGARTVAERHITRMFREIWSRECLELDIDVRALHDYVRSMELGPDWFQELISSSWHGLLDANVIIQAKDLSDIDWVKETKQPKVILWISSILLEELDRLKFYHRSNRVKKRTSNFGRWLAPQMEDAVGGRGIAIRPGVSLRAWTGGRSTPGHDTDHLESALDMRDEGVPVTLVTQDLALQARAIAAGLPVDLLSDESLLPSEEREQGPER